MIQYLPAGTIKRIHVDRRVLAQNLKAGANAPAVTVQTSKGPLKAIQATVLGHSEMMQAGTFIRDADGSRRTVKPLGCGARVWLETRAAVEVIT
jgi:hypothetical protein